jgi:hypothetical protein
LRGISSHGLLQGGNGDRLGGIESGALGDRREELLLRRLQFVGRDHAVAVLVESADHFPESIGAAFGLLGRSGIASARPPGTAPFTPPEHPAPLTTLSAFGTTPLSTGRLPKSEAYRKDHHPTE